MNPITPLSFKLDQLPTNLSFNLHWILRPFGPQDDIILTTNH